MGSIPPRAALGRVPLALPTACVALGVWVGTRDGWWAWLLVPLLFVGLLTPRLRVAACAVVLGLLLGRDGAVRDRPPPSLRSLEVPAVYVLEGRVDAVDLPAWGAQRMTVVLDQIGSPPTRLERPFPMPVTVRLSGRSHWRWHDVVPGTRVRLLARVSMRRDGLRAVVTDRRGLEVLARGEGPTAELARRRRRASWAVARHLDRRDAGLARALLLGDRGRLDRRDRDLFRTTGQAHLLAVSGLHVGLLLGGLVVVLRALGVGLRSTWIAGIALAAVYIPFTGAPPSAVRAGVGAIAWFVGALCMRAPRGLAVLVLVGLLILVSDARNLGSVSFQLSFAAVLSILLLAERLRGLVVRQPLVLPRLAPPKRAPVRTALSVSLAAWLGTAPLVALYIGRLCPAGPLLAVPAVPLTAALLGSGFIVVAADGLPWLQDLAATCFGAVAAVLRAWLTFARALHLDALPAKAPSAAWGAVYVACFVGAVRSERRGMVVGLGGMAVLLTTLLLPITVPGLSVERADRQPRAYDAPVLFLADLPAEPAVVEHDLVLPLSIFALTMFAAFSVRLRWLTVGGAVAAWILGVVTVWQFREFGLAGLFAPFLVATLLGKLPGAERSGARTMRQVICNGLPAFVGVLIAASWDGPEGAQYRELAAMFAGFAWFLGALSCLGADTCATEIGVRYGGKPFRLTGGRVAPGESGGVTVLGLLASVGGAALAPGAVWLTGLLTVEAFLLITAAGFVAALLDSILGGTVQFRGRVEGTGESTEDARRPNATIERVSGWRWLDNDAVNLLTGFVGALLAFVLLGMA